MVFLTKMNLMIILSLLLVTLSHKTYGQKCDASKANKVDQLCTATPDALCWNYHAHGTSATSATLENDRQIKLAGFKYDGKGPGGWWSVKYGAEKTISPLEACADYSTNNILADEYGSCARPTGYDGSKDITLTLPEGRTWADVSWIGIFCYKFGHLFGYVVIPANDELEKLKLAAFQPNAATPDVGKDCETEMVAEFAKPEVDIPPTNPEANFLKCSLEDTTKVTVNKELKLCFP